MFDPDKTTSKRKLLIWVFVFAQIFLNQSSAWAISATSFTPADNATGVSASSNLSIDFDVGWYNESSGSIKLYYANGSLSEYYEGGSGRVTGEGTSTLTIDPTSNLTGGASYYVQITTGRVRDGSWNYYTIGNSTTWNFTVTGGADTTEPSVTTLSPTDNSTGIDANANLVITFNETVDTQSGNLYIKRKSNNNTAETIGITSSKITGNGSTTITINPGNGLLNNIEYYVDMANGVIADAAGNTFDGFTTNGSWNFTTATAAVALGWMRNGWTKRAKITVNESKVNGDVTNFPVYVKLDNLSSLNLFNNTRSDGGDLRVTQGDALTPLPMELVYFDATNNLGELYFRAPYLSATTNLDFYVYYGNANGRPLNASDPLGAHNTWSNGFSAVYHLQDNPNGDVASAVRNSKASQFYGKPHGTMTSSDLVSCQLGKCYDFDGSNDFVSFSDISAMDNASKLTVSTWIKRRSSGSQVTLGKGVNGSTTNRFDIEVVGTGSAGNIYGIVNNSANTSGYFSSDDTNWHHVVLVFNGSGAANSDKLKMYFDGTVQSPTYSGSLPTTMPGNASRFQIGRRVSDSSYTDGYVDEVRIANKLRLKTWTITEYNNQNAPSTFYTVDGTVATNATDSKPKILSTYPDNQGIEVPIRTNLIMNFNENVSAGSGNIVIKRASNGSTFESIAIDSTTISGSQVTINPSSNFASNTEYYITADEGLVVDNGSRHFSGIGSTKGWRFTTSGSHQKETMLYDASF